MAEETDRFTLVVQLTLALTSLPLSFTLLSVFPPAFRYISTSFKEGMREKEISVLILMIAFIHYCFSFVYFAIVFACSYTCHICHV